MIYKQIQPILTYLTGVRLSSCKLMCFLRHHDFLLVILDQHNEECFNYLLFNYFLGTKDTKIHVIWLDAKESGHRVKIIHLNELLSYPSHLAITLFVRVESTLKVKTNSRV